MAHWCYWCDSMLAHWCGSILVWWHIGVIGVIIWWHICVVVCWYGGTLVLLV